jgi:Putative rhamnosyl transferase
MNQFQHFLLTRMNVDWDVSKLRSPTERNSAEFLNHRFKIFEKTCYPAVQAQTNSNFIWFVLFDANLPPAFRERFAAYTSKLQVFPVYMTSKETFLTTLKDSISERLLPTTRYLITTNLDSDDVPSQKFITTIQQQFAEQAFEFINFPFGYLYQFQEQRLYLREWLTSACHTLIEQRQNFQTALVCPHHQILNHPTRQVVTRPMWLMTVHGENVRTRFDVSAAWQPSARLGKDFCSEIEFPSQTWSAALQRMPPEVWSVISSQRHWDNPKVKARKIANILFPQLVRSLRKLRYRQGG